MSLHNKVGALDVIHHEHNKSFEWSFQPIVLWMKTWGIRLDTSKSLGSSAKAIFLALGLLMILTNMSINGFSFYTVLNILVNNETSKIVSYLPKNITSATLVNVGMEQSFTISLMVGDHLIFFVVSLTTWRSLWHQIIQIQTQLELPEKLYKTCRRIAFFGLFILMLDGACYFYLSMESFYWQIEPITPFAIVLGNLSRLWAMSVLAVFCVVVAGLTLVFQTLNQRLEVLTDPKYPEETLAGKLETWRIHHDVVCRAVERMNWCFGLVLLLTISTGFVFFITISYGLIRAIFDKNLDLQRIYSISICQLCWRLFFVIWVSYRLQSKAGLLTKTLRRMRSTFPHDTLLILNTVIVQVSQANSKLTAMDFFDVNLTIFPTLIGTTLTYLVIMFQ